MLAGSLNEFGLADVFSLLGTTRKTGVLNLEGQGAPGRVWIASGALCFAASDITRSPLAARLLHGGQIDDEQVEVLVAAQADGSADAIPDALGALGLDGELVRSLLLDQIVDAVFDLSRWQGGTFAFDQRIEEDPTVPVVAASEVLETVGARLQEWEVIAASRPAADSVLTLVSRPPVSGGFVQVQPADWEVLTLVDGLRTVEDIIELTGQGEFTVSKVLARLVEAGLVQGRDDIFSVTLAEQRRQVLAEAEQRLLGAVGIARPRPSAQPAYDFVPSTDPHGVEGLVDHAATAAVGTAPTGELGIDHGDLTDQLHGLGRGNGGFDGAGPDGGHDAAPADAADHEDHEGQVTDGQFAEGPVSEDQFAEGSVSEGQVSDVADGQASDVVDALADHATDHAASADEAGEDSYEDQDSQPEPADAAQPTDAAQGESPAVDPRRARELAAFGIGDPDAAGDAADAQKPLVRDTSVNADLLARLINGVKGA